MKPSSSHDDAEPTAGIPALMNEFFERRQAGEDLSPEQFAAEHPERAEELRPHLAGLAFIDKACAPPGDSVGDDVPRARAELPKIQGYELIEEIGRGGMGVVYKALQVTTKRVVALKVMLGGPFASPTARRRFEREVELAARLQHPHIVRVLESGHVAGQQYYAMDYVPGVRLDQYLAVERPDVRTILGKLFVRVCDAVEYAHSHGVIHRDLKPGNVLIDEEGVPHILDFGLAKATDQPGSDETLTASISQPGQVLGTLFYLSPEQAAGATDRIDERTDVYALGVMLFEALTGSLPFDPAVRPSEVMQRILEAPPRRPSSVSDRVDGELETIILKALEKEKERRYQSATELADDLRRYLSGDPILARRPSGLYVLRKKLRKHRLGVGIVVAIVVVGLLGVLFESWRSRREWAYARREARDCQQLLERGAVVLGDAKALLERYPHLPEVGLVWAQVNYRDEDTRESAIVYLEEQLRLVPSRWACRALLAEIYRATGDLRRAEELQARAQREAPDTAEAWYVRSFATLDSQRALECTNESLRREPAHVPARCRRTWLCLKNGDLDGALRGADQLIESGEDPSDWIFLRGEILARQGRFREAIEESTRVTIIDPTRLDAYRFRGHAHRRLKEYAKAIADYGILLEGGRERTAEPWTFYQRAAPLWMVGRPEEALQDYRRVRIGLGRPSYGDARRYLILGELGREDEADEVLRNALRDVEDPSWLRQVFRCLAGQLAPDALIANAVARENREHICEAYYYAGEVHLLRGQLGLARERFEQCVATGVEFDLDTYPLTPMNEYELAQWRLDTLLSDINPASQP